MVSYFISFFLLKALIVSLFHWFNGFGCLFCKSALIVKHNLGQDNLLLFILQCLWVSFLFRLILLLIESDIGVELFEIVHRLLLFDHFWVFLLRILNWFIDSGVLEYLVKCWQRSLNQVPSIHVFVKVAKILALYRDLVPILLPLVALVLTPCREILLSLNVPELSFCFLSLIVLDQLVLGFSLPILFNPFCDFDPQLVILFMLTLLLFLDVLDLEDVVEVVANLIIILLRMNLPFHEINWLKRILLILFVKFFIG